MNGVQFLPTDTLFFRDGVPFFVGGPQVDIGGVFPPHPPTMVGALRAALAVSNGWNGYGRWPSKLHAVLGQGLELGTFTVTGPVLLRDGQPLFPAPRHLLGLMAAGEPPDSKMRWVPTATLRPGPPLRCDLGEVRLPQLPSGPTSDDNPEAGDGCWITHAGLCSVLVGQIPATSEVIASDALWLEEPRVGLERERATRTAKEGALYSSRHVRLRRGVSVGARVSGVPSSWKWPWGEPVPFGGESRTCEFDHWDGEPGVPVPPAAREQIEQNGRMLVVALTPLDLEPRLGGELGFPPCFGTVTLVSACMDRAQRIGGWSSLERKPLPLQSVVPAGSVLFCQSDQRKQLGDFLQNNMPPKIGARQAWGFGAIAIGTWHDERESKPT